MYLKRYLDSIGQYPVLGKEECRNLISKAQAGNKKARDKVILGNLRLVIYAVRKFGGITRYDGIDMISEGNIGLIKAVNKFDLSRKTSFSTCAILYIQAEVRRYVQDHSRTVRVPVNLQEKISVLKVRQDKGEKLSEKELKTISLGSPRFTSLDKPISDDGIDTILDIFITDNGFFDKLSRKDYEEKRLEKFIKAINRLPERSRYIMEERFHGRILEDIGLELGICRERIRQIQKESLGKVKYWLGVKDDNG